MYWTQLSNVYAYGYLDEFVIPVPVDETANRPSIKRGSLRSEFGARKPRVLPRQRRNNVKMW